MSQTRPRAIDGPPSAQGPDDAALEDRVAFGEWFRVLRRQKLIAVAVALPLAAGGSFLALDHPSHYAAQAVVMVDPSQTRTDDFRNLLGGLKSDAALVRSEVDVIETVKLAEHVVDRLDLEHDPNFPPPPTLLDRAREKATQLVGRLTSRRPDTPVFDRKAYLANRLLRDLDVLNDGQSFVITVQYSADDPRFAAKVANAFAAAYLEDHVQAKRALGNEVGSWLDGQVAALRRTAEASDRAAQQYKADHGLLENRRGETVIGQRVTALGTELTNAKADLAAKQARLTTLQQLEQSGATASDAAVLNSLTITELRQQELTASRHEQQLDSIYGPLNPEITKAKAERHAIEAKIRAEIGEIADGVSAELTAARDRVASLTQSFEAAEAEAAKTNGATVRLHELQHEADANRKLYQDMLSRSIETRAEREFLLPDARLVSAAAIPLVPAFPTHGLLVEFALALALAAGIAAAFLREWLDPGLHTPDELEAVAGVPAIGMTPKLRRARARFRRRGAVRHKLLNDELLASIRSVLRSRSVGESCKVLLVTSAITGEGKSALALSLSRSLTGASVRTLLIDADLRRPSIRQRMTGGEAMLLIQDGRDIGTLIKDDRTTLEVAMLDRIDTPTFFESDTFKAYIRDARGYYDTVIVDAPPVFPVADSLMLAQVVDSVLFIVKWGSTRRDVVLSALRSLRNSGASIFGAVMTQVDLGKYTLYGYGDGSSYQARSLSHYFEADMAPAGTRRLSAGEAD